MPVEIRELIVKATVRSGSTNRQPRRAPAPPENTSSNAERAAIRRLMQILKDKQER